MNLPKHYIDARKIKILANTRPLAGEFIIDDGSGWCCASCGRSARFNHTLKHKKDCTAQEHWKAIKILSDALPSK